MSGWAYILLCSDKSFYVGSTSHDDVATRIIEHNDAKFVGYTTRRRPVRLVWAKAFDDLRDAHETERRLKGWSRAKKFALINGDETKLKMLATRRAGREHDVSAVKLTKKQLAVLVQSTGAKHAAKPARPRRPTSTERTGGSDKPFTKLASSRHPEVRSRAERGGAPKDE